MQSVKSKVQRAKGKGQKANSKKLAFSLASLRRQAHSLRQGLAVRFILPSCLLALFLALPSSAMPWNNKRLPDIYPPDKLSYVNIDWWDNFSDPMLKCYILQAIANNHDAKKASWKVEEYKYNIKLQFSKELPSLSVGGDYILNHVPDTIKGTKSNIFAVPFLASYEADIFLKNHDKTKSTKMAYQSSKFQEQSVYISLASDVATTYINLIKYDKQIQIQKEFLDVKTEELKREEARYKRGVTSVPKLNEYKKAYESAKSDLDELIKSRDKALNQLAVLIGECPENVSTIKRSSWDDFYYKNQIPTEISSDVTFCRPDILAAEADLEKANIDVRVARKEFLPTFKINGIYSLSNIGPDGFGTWGSTIAALVAGATLDLFKGGYKVANLKVYKAKYEQMFEAYRQADLKALKEVNDSLLIIKEDTKIDANAGEKLKIETDNYQRATESYKKGVISYPDLLSSQEQLLNMEQNKISSKTNVLINYITLYKAVGGKL